MSGVTTSLRHNDYVKSIAVIVIIVGIVLGAFVGLRFVLNTEVPVRVVESGSMCVPEGGFCDGWSHPFDQTLHVGDIIIIQGVKPEELNVNYPYSDIIVYQNPTNPSATPIVHRIVAVDNINGTLYFQTKGDGNEQKWDKVPPVSMYDSNTLWTTGQGVPTELIEGRVVLRIPWFGWITLFMRENPWGLPVIIALILILVVVEFIIPIMKSSTKQETSQQQTQNPSAENSTQPAAPGNGENKENETPPE